MEPFLFFLSVHSVCCCPGQSSFFPPLSYYLSVYIIRHPTIRVGCILIIIIEYEIQFAFLQLEVLV